MDNSNVNMSFSLHMQFVWVYCAFSDWGVQKAPWSIFTHTIDVQEVTHLVFSHKCILEIKANIDKNSVFSTKFSKGQNHRY
jgi:hypothetical protein